MAIFGKKDKKEIIERSVDISAQNNESTAENTLFPVGLDFLNPYLSKGEATAISAFFSGLQLISSTIASIPIHVRNVQTGQIENHAINDAFKNSLISDFNTLKNLIWDLYYSGNGLAYIRRLYDGTPKEIIYCPSGSYSIIYDQFNRKLYYLIPGISKKKIEPINVLHLVMNSKDGVQGTPIPIFAKKVLDIALATDNHAKCYFENGANIDGILKSSKPLSSAQKQDIKQSWQAVHGVGKTGGIAVIGNDMDYIPVGSNANDSEMIQSREFNAQEVCRYLNIDPLLLGLASSASYNSIEQAQLSFLSHCIYPLVSLMEAEFNRKLIKPSERNTYVIDFDENHIMFADKSATATFYSTLVKNGIMSINEARHNLGLTPMEGGDKLIIPFTDISQNTISENNENKENDEKDKNDNLNN